MIRLHNWQLMLYQSKLFCEDMGCSVDTRVIGNHDRQLLKGFVKMSPVNSENKENQ